MHEIKAYSIEMAFDTISKLENRLNDMEKCVAIISKLESRLNEMEKAVAVLSEFKELINERSSYTQKAVDKAEQSVNTRLASMNEFRDQLKDQAKTFVTFDVYNANHKSIEIKIEAIQKIVWSGLAIVSFLVFAVPLFMHFLELVK
ncbi:MAG: hypothetical protein QG641_2050 [Candidatus Poribacteria bacterium]|nr:hypothetical protein [Candidatus Poribacteria bacterium]MDQ1328764.1 hypothetical protein [Candidatus Poribacteria bacterium]